MNLEDFDLKAHVEVVRFFWDESKKIAAKDHIPQEFQIQLTKMMFDSYLSEITSMVRVDDSDFPRHV